MEEAASSAESGPDALPLLRHSVHAHILTALLYSCTDLLAFTYIINAGKHGHARKHTLQMLKDMHIGTSMPPEFSYTYAHSHANPHLRLVQLT